MLNLITAYLAPDVESKIVGASLFKNGYAMVVREIDAPTGGAVITKIPNASLGTLWITSSDGLKLRGIVNTTREVEGTRAPNNIAEFLQANIGAQATLQVEGSKPMDVMGKIELVNGDIVVISNGASHTALRIGQISGVNVQSSTNPSLKTNSTQRALQFLGEGSGKIYMVGLEQGMTWAPSYTIDISDPKKLRLLAKATVINDLGDFKNVDLKFVTGFPNVPFAGYREPILSGDAVTSFVNMLNSIGGPTGQSFAANRPGSMMMNQSARGGFGADEMEILGGGANETKEDLFFYSMPNVTMKNGDRGFYLLFEASSEFDRLFTLDIPNTITEEYQQSNAQLPDVPWDVWNTLKFKNPSKQPLTTGPATVFKGDQIMGQDTMTYTPVGADATIRMSKALDVQNEALEEETARQRDALQLPSYGRFDLVTIKGTINLKNRKAEAIKLRTTKTILGEVATSDNGATVVKSVKGLRQVNPRATLTWNATLPAGKTLTLNYTYKIYVRN